MTSPLRTAALLFTVALNRPALAEPVALAEKPGHVTTAIATVDASPSEVYRLITDYARWPSILSDVTSVRVERGGARDARVRFRSKALEHEVAIEFDNLPDREIRFHSVDAPPGAHAHGDYVLEPIDGGRRTRVIATFYLHVGGVSRVLVSASKVRRMRRAKLEHDFEDVIARYADRKPASPSS